MQKAPPIGGRCQPKCPPLESCLRSQTIPTSEFSRSRPDIEKLLQTARGCRTSYLETGGSFTQRNPVNSSDRVAGIAAHSKLTASFRSMVL